jgi:hypothetical protein
MRLLFLFLLVSVLASCGGFTQRRYLDRSLHAHHIAPPSTPVAYRPAATADIPDRPLRCKESDLSFSPPDTVVPPDTAAPKNIFDKFRARDDADRARRAVNSGLLSTAGALVYYLSGYATLTQIPDPRNGQALVVVFLVLIPLCFLIGMLSVAFGVFAMYRGFRVKKNNTGKETYAGKGTSAAGILLGLLGVLLTITATILLRQL